MLIQRADANWQVTKTINHVFEVLGDTHNFQFLKIASGWKKSFINFE